MEADWMERFNIYRMRSDAKPRDFIWQTENGPYKYVGLNRECEPSELERFNLEIVGKMTRRAFENYSKKRR